MDMHYSSSDSHVIAYDYALQEIHESNVTPNPLNLYWGTAQVIKLTKKVMGSSIKLVYPYPTKVKIQGLPQYITLAHCKVKLAKQCIKAMAKKHVIVLNLFEIQLCQESHDDDNHWPPFSPPKKRHNPDGCGSASRKCPPCYYNDT